jgi:small ligand-binding sensory domain FIST
MRAGAGLSTHPETRGAAVQAALAAREGLAGAPADLAVVFASLHHADAAADLVDAVHEAVSPAGLIGCVAEAVLGGPREVEDQAAVSVWLGSLPGGAETFHMEFVRTESGGVFAGWRFEADDGPPRAHLLIADPFSFPVDLLLQHLNEQLPGARVIGGLASGSAEPGATVLLQDHQVHHEGAVGARLPSSVSVRTLVSQGCRPIGSAFVVTKAEENFVFELAGETPMERLREVVGRLGAADRELLQSGIQLGRVIDEYKPEYGQGDFLIRGVVGADPKNGAMAVGDLLQVGQTVQFHVRDAASADEELRMLLEREIHEMPGRPAGALLFTCNGRGSRMFPTPDHDAKLVSSYLGGAPLAGFFAAGEFGPVGGKNFLHGFTASLVMFSDAPVTRRPA